MLLLRITWKILQVTIEWFETARQKLMAEEVKALELDNMIRKLEKEKQSIKKHADHLHQKVIPQISCFGPSTSHL